MFPQLQHVWRVVPPVWGDSSAAVAQAETSWDRHTKCWLGSSLIMWQELFITVRRSEVKKCSTLWIYFRWQGNKSFGNLSKTLWVSQVSYCFSYITVYDHICICKIIKIWMIYVSYDGVCTNKINKYHDQLPSGKLT